MITEQLIINGDFETQLASDGSFPLSWSSSPGVMHNSPLESYVGNWCAQMGKTSSEKLTQTLTVPESSSVILSFYMSILNKTADKADAYSTLSLKVKQVNDSNYTTVQTWTNQSSLVAQGYRIIFFDLTAYAGQTVQICFEFASTNMAKLTYYYIDDVRLTAVLVLPASTYPPLVSNESRDGAGGVQLYGNTIITSAVIREQADDPFFHPELGLNGFGYNGCQYQHGALTGTTRSEWWVEAQAGGDQLFRGSTSDFPAAALCLATTDAISILDITDNMTMWMIFRQGAGCAYSTHFGLGDGALFIPASFSYASGLLSLLFTPKLGSTYTQPVTLNIDFTKDFIYLDTNMS